jgi:hypothetical protein
MIVLQRNIAAKSEIPTMTREELESAWHKAMEYFEQTRAQKVEVDHVYLAAANELNAIERLVHKLDHRAAMARREAEKALRAASTSRR